MLYLQNQSDKGTLICHIATYDRSLAFWLALEWFFFLEKQAAGRIYFNSLRAFASSGLSFPRPLRQTAELLAWEG